METEKNDHPGIQFSRTSSTEKDDHPQIQFSRSLEDGNSSISTSSDCTSKSLNIKALDTPRLVHRDLPFHQSTNYVRVENNSNAGFPTISLLRHDWFHSLLQLPTQVSVSLIMSLWMGMILAFAGVYVAVDNIDPQRECGLGEANNPIHFAGAFAFSLETCTTVGYGLPGSSNAYFEQNCGGMQFVIAIQMICSMLFNAFFFAFFYSRLAKSDNRGVQVVMSRNAVVSLVDGQVRFQNRVYDMNAKHPVAEAHVRLYVVNKGRPVPQPLRVLEPSDDFGASLFLSMPTVVSHRVDLNSAMKPATDNASLHLTGHNFDGLVGSCDAVVCPICSTSFDTHERWVRHVRYQQLVERKEGYPEQGTHLCLTEEDLASPKFPTTETIQDLKDHFASELSEIICVVEATDPITSGTFQSLQSYTLDDIVWDADAQFQPCLDVSGKDVRVDLKRFHEIAKVGFDSESIKTLRTHDSFVVRDEETAFTKCVP